MLWKTHEFDPVLSELNENVWELMINCVGNTSGKSIDVDMMNTPAE